MQNYLLVGAGSFFGGIFRYYLSGLALQSFGTLKFPLGTFLVNILGCLAIGLVGGLAEHRHLFSPLSRVFIITGLLGGFTTFSAFGYETVYLLRTNNLHLAIGNVVLSIFLCLGSVWLGIRLSQIF